MTDDDNNIRSFPSFPRPNSQEYIWEDMNSGGKDSYNWLPGEKLRKDDNMRLPMTYKEIIEKDIRFIASHIKLIKNQPHLQTLLFSRIANLNDLTYRCYELDDVLKNEEGHRSTSSESEVTATKRFQKSSENAKKNEGGAGIEHGCQQAYKRDHEYCVEKSKSQRSIIDNDNHESCLKMIEKLKSELEGRPLECRKCVRIATIKIIEINSLLYRTLKNKTLLSAKSKCVRRRKGRSKGKAQENLEFTQKLSDLQSSLDKAIGENTHLLKENTNLLQKLSAIDKKYQDICNRYEESTKNVQQANDQLKKKQILLDNAILSGENLMHAIEKTNEQALTCSDLANARTQDAINSDNKFKDLRKQYDYLTDELKESQQKYELQSKEFQEVIKKVNEYELLLYEASKRCDAVINELKNLTQND